MMYPEELVTPMRRELTDHGFTELKTAEEVVHALKEKKGTALVVVNSVCGCSARSARPGVLIGLEESAKKPTYLYTVFAGMEASAVDKLRELALPYPPSSPSIMFFKDGELLHMIERRHIEGFTEEEVAEHLKDTLEESI